MDKLNLSNIKANNFIAMKNFIDQLKVEREISRVPVSPSRIRIPKTSFILDGWTSKGFEAAFPISITLLLTI